MKPTYTVTMKHIFCSYIMVRLCVIFYRSITRLHPCLVCYSKAASFFVGMLNILPFKHVLVRPISGGFLSYAAITLHPCFNVTIRLYQFSDCVLFACMLWPDCVLFTCILWPDCILFACYGQIAASCIHVMVRLQPLTYMF